MAIVTAPRGKTNGKAPAPVVLDRDVEAPAGATGLILQIPLALIDVDANIRVSVDAIEELAASIAEHGVRQPISVRDVAGDRYAINFGQRRFLASKLAGAIAIPAFVDNEARTPAELAILQLIENLAREDLPPLDRARAMRAVVDGGMTQADLARQLGLGASTIANDLGLLEAPDAIKDLIGQGELTPAHAKAMKGLAPKTQLELARDVIKRGLSAHATEAEVQERKRRADAEREHQQSEAKDREARRAELAASIEPEVAKKKVPKDAPIIVVSDYYGTEKVKDVGALLGAAGFANVTQPTGYSRGIESRPAGCTCTAWKATVAESYENLPKGGYRRHHRIVLTKGCVDSKHAAAKASADEAKRRAKVALEEAVQQHVRKAPLGVVIPQTSPETPDLFGVPRILAESALWSILGYSSASFAAARGGSRSNPWPTIHGLSDEDLAAELAKAIAGDFRDHAGYHVDWPGLAAELGIETSA